MNKALLDALQHGAKGLRKSAISNDLSAPLTGAQFAETDEKWNEYHLKVLDINLEEWIHLIPEYTFKTELMPITPEDADIFVQSYLEYESHLDHATLVGKSDARLSAMGSFTPSNTLLQRAEELQRRLQSVFDLLIDGNTSGVFVKTSCRSPKDSPTSQIKLQEYYLKMLAECEDRSENTRITTLLRAGLETMRMRNADDALALLMRSRRIWQDMGLALLHPERWNQHIVVRRWQDIEVDMEFRCFVYGNRLTAISQYNHLCFFPSLVASQEIIRLNLQRFFEQRVRPALEGKFVNYVMDVAIIGEGFDNVLVIELNPFLETTDSCCFSWSADLAVDTHAIEAKSYDVSSAIVQFPFFDSGSVEALLTTQI
eukprot:gene2288-3007_t